LLQLAEITELGITHVVDVRVEWSDEQLFADWAPSVTYLHHGLDDLGQAVPPVWFERAVTWVEAALVKHPDAVVLTHCHMGINRGRPSGSRCCSPRAGIRSRPSPRSAQLGRRPTSGLPPTRSPGITDATVSTR
jgi:hypothetical protein